MAPSVDLQLVIFDCDGVLVDSEVISNRVLAAMLTEHGLPTTLPQARREYQGLLLADVVARAEAKRGRVFPAGWLARYEAERAEAFRRELAPVAGVAETVEQLRVAGRKVCVASQGKLASNTFAGHGHSASSSISATRSTSPLGSTASTIGTPRPTCPASIAADASTRRLRFAYSSSPTAFRACSAS